MKIETHLKPKPAQEILIKRLNDGAILYEPEKDKIHTLNKTAAYIWTLCDGVTTVGEIIEQIKIEFREFETKPDAAVKKALTQLNTKGLIHFS